MNNSRNSNEKSITYSLHQTAIHVPSSISGITGESLALTAVQVHTSPLIVSHYAKLLTGSASSDSVTRMGNHQGRVSFSQIYQVSPYPADFCVLHKSCQSPFFCRQVLRSILLSTRSSYRTEMSVKRNACHELQ